MATRFPYKLQDPPLLGSAWLGCRLVTRSRTKRGDVNMKGLPGESSHPASGRAWTQFTQTVVAMETRRPAVLLPAASCRALVRAWGVGVEESGVGGLGFVDP